MSEEEKKAIEELQEEINKPVEVSGDKFDTFILYNIKSAKTILNLISNLQKELNKKDKVIDEILNWERTNIILGKCAYCKDETIDCKDCIKQYFYKKAEEENE